MKLLYLKVISARKASQYDFMYDRIHGTVTWRSEPIAIPGFSDVWLMPELGVSNTIVARSEMLPMFPQRTVPNLSEMGVVCYQTGLMPNNQTFHAPHAKTVEVPEVIRPEDARGIFSTPEIIYLF